MGADSAMCTFPCFGFVVVFETGSLYVGQAGLLLNVYWRPFCLVLFLYSLYIGNESRASYIINRQALHPNPT